MCRCVQEERTRRLVVGIEGEEGIGQPVPYKCLAPFLACR